MVAYLHFNGRTWDVLDAQTGALIGTYKTRWEAQAVREAYAKANA